MRKFHSTSNITNITKESGPSTLELPQVGYLNKDSPRQSKRHKSRKSALIFYNSPISLIEKHSTKDSKICISDFWKNETKLRLRRKFQIKITKVNDLKKNPKNSSLPKISKKSSFNFEIGCSSTSDRMSLSPRVKTVDDIIYQCQNEIDKETSKSVAKMTEQMKMKMKMNLVKKLLKIPI